MTDERVKEMEAELESARVEARRATALLDQASELTRSRLESEWTVRVSRLQAELEGRIAQLLMENQRLQTELMYRTDMLDAEMMRWKAQAEHSNKAVAEARSELLARKRELDATNTKLNRVVETLGWNNNNSGMDHLGPGHAPGGVVLEELPPVDEAVGRKGRKGAAAGKQLAALPAAGGGAGKEVAGPGRRGGGARGGAGPSTLVSPTKRGGGTVGRGGAGVGNAPYGPSANAYAGLGGMGMPMPVPNMMGSWMLGPNPNLGGMGGIGSGAGGHSFYGNVLHAAPVSGAWSGAQYSAVNGYPQSSAAMQMPMNNNMNMNMPTPMPMPMPMPGPAMNGNANMGGNMSNHHHQNNLHHQHHVQGNYQTPAGPRVGAPGPAPTRMVEVGANEAPETAPHPPGGKIRTGPGAKSGPGNPIPRKPVLPAKAPVRGGWGDAPSREAESKLSYGNPRNW